MAPISKRIEQTDVLHEQPALLAIGHLGGYSISLAGREVTDAKAASVCSSRIDMAIPLSAANGIDQAALFKIGSDDAEKTGHDPSNSGFINPDRSTDLGVRQSERTQPQHLAHRLRKSVDHAMKPVDVFADDGLIVDCASSIHELLHRVVPARLAVTIPPRMVHG